MAVYVAVPGWVGLYINNFLVAQGSSIDLPSYLDNSVVMFNTRKPNPRDAEVVTKYFGFPEMLSELDQFGRE